MRPIRQFAPALLAVVVASACATTSRMPVTDVPAGTYVLVEPESEEYHAVAINESAFAVREGNMTLTGQHWLDSDGRLHMTVDSGPCAGQESIWTYSYANNRVTLNLIEDMCTARDPAFPQQLVYERQ